MKNNIMIIILFLALFVNEVHSGTKGTEFGAHAIRVQRSIAKDRGLWSTNEVPYVIDPDMPNFRRETIKRAIEQFKKYTCIKIVPRTNQKNYLSIRATTTDACFAEVGMKGGEQLMNFSARCKVSDFMHEFMHTLDFIHEQTRADRDKYVTIHLENADPMQSVLAKNALEPKFDLNDKFKNFPYDYRSLMHYKAATYAKVGTKTMTINNARYKYLEDLMGNETGFSTCDVYKMNTVYGCKTYTDKERDDLCYNNPKRYALVSCPTKDQYDLCRKANQWLCDSQPGTYLMKCPVACNNCEGNCDDSLSSNDQDQCERIRQKRRGKKYQCDTKESIMCPLACGLC